MEAKRMEGCKMGRTIRFILNDDMAGQMLL